MDQEILTILSTYGVEAIVISLIINVLTNLLKQPIKAYSKRSGRNINKYISFIPVAMGFAGAALYYGFVKGWANLRVDEVVSLAISSASLSLAMFAIIEKFLPKKKTLAEQTEQTEPDNGTKRIIAELKRIGKAVGLIEEAELVKAEGSESVAENKRQETAAPMTAVIAAPITGENKPARGKIILGRKKESDINANENRA